MRLCGHDCVVSDRYDSGSVGSGRYFYRLDPQDPLNFGRNLLSLVLTRASGPVPPCRSSNWHKERTRRYTGTEKELICNARVYAVHLSAHICARLENHLRNRHKVGRQGPGLGSTLGSTKTGRRNATAQTLLVTTVIDSL